MGRNFLGEFEQRVLLAILRCDRKAYPIDIRREVTRASGHEPSRGAFYTTLDRLEAKKLVRWTTESGDAGRDGLPQRRFSVTAEGLAALRASRKTLLDLWRGLEDVLAES
jgi:DNA-binding PadR family transcriptional regulator